MNSLSIRAGVVAAALLAAACSSSSSSPSTSHGSEAGPIPQAFAAKWCTGTLKTDKELMPPQKGGGWLGDGSVHAPAGTTFLVSPEFGQWNGYAFLSDGTPAAIAGDIQTGLAAGTDFTSTCATDPNTMSTHFILLAPAQLYAKADLSGTPCSLAVGLELTNAVYSGGDVPQLAGDQIQARCGFRTGYASTLSYGMLITP